jgi:UDP-2-acetamido-2,6-beta-L-arabino-hexul-4-ose reductase
MRLVVTGADGFIGRNLRAALLGVSEVDVVSITRSSTDSDLKAAVIGADAVVHLAGVNRPPNEEEFDRGNAGLTRQVCDAVRAAGRAVPVLLASSTQAERDNPYGRSKRAAEELVFDLRAATGSPIAVYRLPNVFGKWARPQYNSVVATFCHNAVHGLPLEIHEPDAVLRLVYVDDVIADFRRRLDGDWPASGRADVAPVYETTVGELAAAILEFRDSRRTLVLPAVGVGLARALYATYVSYFGPAHASYALARHADERGAFIEVLKTTNSGQFSFFTAHPGAIRGGHYHHSKTEKFLVVRGSARFRFRHILTQESFDLCTSSDQPMIVETLPGWAHDITNVGAEEMLVLLWANEMFDRNRPDTYAQRLN